MEASDETRGTMIANLIILNNIFQLHHFSAGGGGRRGVEKVICRPLDKIISTIIVN